jgi:hypothetical protein
MCKSTYPLPTCEPAYGSAKPLPGCDDVAASIERERLFAGRHPQPSTNPSNDIFHGGSVHPEGFVVLDIIQRGRKDGPHKPSRLFPTTHCALLSCWRAAGYHGHSRSSDCGN